MTTCRIQSQGGFAGCWISILDVTGQSTPCCLKQALASWGHTCPLPCCWMLQAAATSGLVAGMWLMVGSDVSPKPPACSSTACISMYLGHHLQMFASRARGNSQFCKGLQEDDSKVMQCT